MEIKLSILLLFIYFGIIFADPDPNAFCLLVHSGPGTYCSANFSGYYECWNNPQKDAIYFNCPGDTVCLCFEDSPCNSQSVTPCGNAEQVPTFPKEYIRNSTWHYYYSGPNNGYTIDLQETEYFDWKGQQSRLDRTGTQNGGPNPGPISTSDFVYAISDEETLTIHVNWLTQKCINITSNSSFQMEGVPQGFLTLNASDFEQVWWWEFVGNPGIGGSVKYATVQLTDITGVVIPISHEEHTNTGNQGMTNTVIKGTTYFIELETPQWFYFIFPDFLNYNYRQQFTIGLQIE